ncbi:hypothetical protein AVEN_260211-1 [Araneus ventricosus]|uniref:Uncharacterized protein n=1 Tax=Araneus ventricosus TaxID=182803 RepID=A0A4Y2JRM6_ARAVE|nr:hypothetical protein AVEN_260211-1 [Araneus ventricosus]
MGSTLKHHPFSGLVASAEPLRTSTRVSSGLVLPGHSSPSFGSQRVCSNSAQPINWKGRVVGAPLVRRRRDPNTVGVESDLCFHCASGLIRDPLTRTHVRLLGPCFKTGRVGDRSTPREPPTSDWSTAANEEAVFRWATESVRAPSEVLTPACR